MDRKVFLISGGSSGIGLSIADRLVQDGHQVISLSRSPEKVERALKEMPHLKDEVDFVNGDISDPGDADRLFREIEAKYGKLDGLVNNAGVLTKGTIETVSVEDWQFTLDVNLTGPYILTRAMLPLLRNAGALYSDQGHAAPLA